VQRIDWYILKNFLVTFFFCMLLFTLVAVAVDSSEHADDFVRAKFSTREIIEKYYLGFVPYIWSLLFPLFVFIAVIFFTSRLAARSEIIAILASGTPYTRFLRPYWVGGILLASLLWVGSRYWIPKANIIRAEFQSKYIDQNDPTRNVFTTNCANCFYRRIDTNTFVGIRDYDTATRTARGFFMERVKGTRVYYNLRGETMTWDTALTKWKLYRVVERKVDSIGERIAYLDTMVLSIPLKPAELRRDEYLKDKLTTPELKALIRREKQRGTEGLSASQVEWYRRTATPVSVVLLTLIGVVVASRKTRGGSGVHLAIGIVIASLYIMSDRFSTVFAVKGSLPPILAAWLPNVVFGGVAYWMYRRTPK
jgi:lipopolysaccharide export system permease protein